MDWGHCRIPKGPDLENGWKNFVPGRGDLEEQVRPPGGWLASRGQRGHVHTLQPGLLEGQPPWNIFPIHVSLKFELHIESFAFYFRPIFFYK